MESPNTQWPKYHRQQGALCICFSRVSGCKWQYLSIPLLMDFQSCFDIFPAPPDVLLPAIVSQLCLRLLSSCHARWRAYPWPSYITAPVLNPWPPIITATLLKPRPPRVKKPVIQPRPSSITGPVLKPRAKAFNHARRNVKASASVSASASASASDSVSASATHGQGPPALQWHIASATQRHGSLALKWHSDIATQGRGPSALH